MKVAFVLESPLRYGGGVSAVVRTLMEELPESYRLILISRDAPGTLDGDPLFRRMEMHIPFFGEKGAPHPEFFRARKPILEKLRKAGPDLVHFHSGGVYSWGNRWPGASWPAALKKQGICSVWTNHLVVDRLHGFCGEKKPRFFKELIWPLARLAKRQQIKAVAKEICVSEENARKMRSWFPGSSGKIVRIYHSRIDADHLSPPEVQNREKMILAVGHLAFRKGQQILTRAFCGLAKNYRDWRLVLVGPGEKEACGVCVQQLAHGHGISDRVQLAGQQENSGDWMGRAAIFVQPSFQEGLPLALQEAMAAGCPAVATRVAGNPELVKDGETGFLVLAGDVQAMEEKLRWLMDRPAGRTEMGKKGYERILALGMTRQAMVHSHEELYRQVVGETLP